jgi:hypothetical protein
VQLPSLQLPQLVQRTATCELAAHRLPSAGATSATAISASATQGAQRLSSAAGCAHRFAVRCCN